MVQTVAKISQTQVDKLMANTIWEYFFELNEKGEICMDLRDAIEALQPDEFEEIEWFDYTDKNNNFIGIPKSKKKRN